MIPVSNVSLTSSYNFLRQQFNAVADAMTNKVITLGTSATGNLSVVGSGTFTSLFANTSLANTFVVSSANGVSNTTMSWNSSTSALRVAHPSGNYLDLTATTLTVNTHVVWHDGNLTPANYAALGANVTFANVVSTNATFTTATINTSTANNVQTNNVTIGGGAFKLFVNSANPTINFTGSESLYVQPGIKQWVLNTNSAVSMTVTAAGTTVYNSLYVNGPIVGTTGQIYAFGADGNANTGYVFLKSDSTKYLGFDGTNYLLPGSDLYVNGSKAWTGATLNPTLYAPKASPTFTGVATAPQYNATSGAIYSYGLGGNNNVGAIYLNSAGTRYLYYDGTGAYGLVGAQLYINGSQAWHAGNFNPGLYAPLANPSFSGTLYAPVISTPTLYSNYVDVSRGANFSYGDGAGYTMLVHSAGEAAIGFLRDGIYGAKFGIAADNTFTWGSWSMGGTAMKLYQDGNIYTPMFGYLSNKFSQVQSDATNNATNNANAYTNGFVNSVRVVDAGNDYFNTGGDNADSVGSSLTSGFGFAFSSGSYIEGYMSRRYLQLYYPSLGGWVTV